MAFSKKKTEEERQLSQVEELELMCKSNGWMIAREMIISKIADLGNILTLDNPDMNKLSIEIGARQLAVQTLLEFLKGIDAAIKTKNSYQNTFNKTSEFSFIQRTK